MRKYLVCRLIFIDRTYLCLQERQEYRGYFLSEPILVVSNPSSSNQNACYHILALRQASDIIVVSAKAEVYLNH